MSVAIASANKEVEVEFSEHPRARIKDGVKSSIHRDCDGYQTQARSQGSQQQQLHGLQHFSKGLFLHSFLLPELQSRHNHVTVFKIFMEKAREKCL